MFNKKLKTQARQMAKAITSAPLLITTAGDGRVRKECPFCDAHLTTNNLYYSITNMPHEDYCIYNVASDFLLED